ncbi:YhgE/Pip domain-containing protein [Agreia sp. PsM10]|uniref:YhgE/Pip domain-containing protein n=1 Tax=Agreia sp. PsM10 TaxID=3030533 RepID=UPI00263BCD14|nr:YhgE/Pip domain-containing protein [Agreia sp. PsM10]MDN4642087.1 YhgE/Pip domain-containing protein [Agreia sp. PsM10]
MTIVTLVRAELRRLTSSKMGILALVALMCVPIIYAGLYLWGNNDPYGNLKDVPVGLVVEDTGATQTDSDGTTSTVNYGDEVRDELLKDNSVKWIEATAAEAKTGVSDGTFDFVLTLGKDFSTDLTSPITASPKQASVELTTNDTNSFLATTIAGNVAEKVRSSIAEKVGKEAALQFLDGFADVGTSLETAIDGANQLADGTTTAANGAATLSAGAATVNDGAQQLATGATEVNTGAGTLADGAAAVDDAAQKLSAGAGTTNAGMIQLLAGLTTLQTNVATLPQDTAVLAAGAQKVSDGNAALSTAAAPIAAAAQEAADKVPEIRAQIQETMTNDGFTQDQIDAVLAELDPLGDKVIAANDEATALNLQLGDLAAGSAQVAAGTAQLAAAAPALTDGVNQAAAAASQIQSGTQQVADGNAALAAQTPTLASGASTLAAGTQQLSDGATALADGTPALATGAADLQTGILKLDDGAHKLATGLTEGLGKLPIETAAEREKSASIISDPAAIDTSAVTKASTYGAGMAPFFISLAAWIGIYALFLIIKPLSKRALTALRKPVRVTAAGLMTPGILGAVQMIAVFGIVTLALGYSVANPLGMLGFMIVTSMTYAAIILALNVWLGSVGQFLGLVLMVLQLVTAGGTFPWQTLPGPLAALHHALPMGYAVDGIRQLMYGGNLALAWADVAVLLAFLLGALALSWLGARRMTRTRTLRDLRPSLIG